MSERLTQRNLVQGPRWVSWIPYLLLFVFALALSVLAPRSWMPPPEPGPLYLSLCGAIPPGIAPYWHVLLALALLQGGGILVRNLLPPKSPAPTKILAQSLGGLTLLVTLTPWFRDLLHPVSVLPAVTALVWAQIILLQSLSAGKHTRAALAGLLAGLAAGLSLFVGLGILPLGIWLITDLIRKTNQAPRRTGFFIAGAVIALLPFARELPARILNTAFSPENGLQTLAPLYTLFGIGGLLLILLGLLVGALQKNRILLTFMLTTGLLFKAGHIAHTDPSRLYTGVILFYPALLCAYGIFRLLKGIESGVYAVNPAKAKHITLVFLILLLIGAKLWTARILQQI
ncbi:MAG: hypothetical protein JJU05_07340 [Verrucomicrobia bacterium]|nr:hypothetical protein [Verrucomicrobiota bacterium]MCH8526111.1 hypothetical protein [Kiritimatiellia bacterium]